MTDGTPSSAAADLAPPVHIFPLVRHLSYRTTPLLLRLGLTPNQITAVSLAFGLAAAVGLMETGSAVHIFAGLLLVVCYVLDNCDGEVARLRQLATRFGAAYDTAVDWLVHAAVFFALGVGQWRDDGNALWIWLGGAAALGGTINFVVGIVLVLALVEYEWLLLPAGAIGAQVYWFASLIKGARRHHV